MASRNPSFSLICSNYIIIQLYLFSFTLIAAQNANDCTIEGYNLSLLQKFSPWHTVNDIISATFQINVCNKLKIDPSSSATNCPDGTSICAHFPNGTVVNYGSYSSDPSSSPDSENGEVLMLFQGQSCPHFDGETYSTIIYFKCGKTLGHPYHLGDLGCSTHFEWESYIFCKDLPVPKNDVPCTVMKDGHLIDLSPLTKLTGSYLVDATENRKLFINVCREIKKSTTADANDPLSHCPEGTGSCRILNDNDGSDYGQPLQRLQATSSGVKLVYTSTTKPTGCLDTPTTTINFQCPQRGGSKDPVLLTDFLVSCSIEIEWVTEYACPVDHVTSTTCQLTSAQHDVDIDLSPLKHPQRFPNPYLVHVPDGDDKYLYYINVCEQLGFPCGSDATGLATICQKKENDASFSREAGSKQHMKLRYSDGELTMIYGHGEKCHTNFRRTTFINFVCNKTAANDGDGYPEFVSHEDCSYTFNWPTKYACVDHPVADTCRVDYKGKRYDLSSLVKEQGGYWEVLVGDKENSDTSYFVNICHDVFKEGSADGCPAGAAMCAKGPSGFTNLGKYIQPLQYDESSKSLKLVYTEGDKTENKCARTTVINFYCLPGVADSAPLLVHKSVDGCYYEVEWHTAAACVLSHKKGDNCKVVDDDAGYTFDLSPLKKATGSYSVEASDGYTYNINVCDEIKGDNPCSAPPHSSAAICQVKRGHETDVKKIAEPATVLEYYDGVLNLTYTNGELYNNPDHTPRSAEIAFVCDMNKGKGKPEFLEEKDFTYAFIWRTNYACPVPPIECAVTDTSKNVQYDLSSLSKTNENWVWIDDDATKTRQKFYINVCRPLNVTKNMHCSSFASVCVTNVDEHGKETLLHGNLGRLEQSPQPEKTLVGTKIVYINGNDCVNNGVKQKFRTIVHFVCSKGKLTGKPNEPILIRPCEYSIVWETEAACPIEQTTSGSGEHNSSGNCTVKDPNSDFIFNLKPLAKKGNDFYEVKNHDGKTTHKLNVCGSLSESICGKFDSTHGTSVCEGSTAVAMIGSDLSHSSTGEITLEYGGKSNMATGMEKKYILNFICDRNAQTPVFNLEKQETLETVFRIATALACAPQPVDCTAQDDLGKEFDLSSLAKKDSNWIVIDTRPSHVNLQYHINVCRPVNPTTQMTCPGGAVGACQTGDKSFNMGYVQSKPVAASNGSAITIRYQGGDICHEGKANQAHRSTRIIFTCAEVEKDPVFLSESDTCEYTFIWETPSACPQHSTTGTNCKVKDQLYGYEFDLNTLRKSSDNYVVNGNGYNFILNVCGPLVKSSATCQGENVGACQTGGGLSSPVELGKSSSDLIYDSGELRLVYTEGKANCHGKFIRKTIIRFLCNHSSDGVDGPSYVEERSDCTYEFIWGSRLACPPYQVKDCTFQHGNNIYDLSALELVDNNYEGLYLASSKRYVLNVCRSLVHQKGVTCPHNSAACEIDMSETDVKKKFHNIGDVSTTSFSFENNKLLLKYRNGDKCKGGTQNLTTTVVFDCDKDSNALGVPKSHFVVNECDHHFLWKSRAACPLVNTGGTEISKGFGNCKVKNPQTGYEFDLSKLKTSSGYKTYDREGHLFTLNICGWLDASSGCPNRTGSCQSGMEAGSNPVNAGLANANPIFRDGVLALEYSGGAPCKFSKTRHTTIINFVCTQLSGNGVPVFIDKSDDCTYYFDWHTDLVCETQVTCSVKTENGSTLDFGPLVQHSGKYNVLENAIASNRSPGLIFLNLCRPLNPVFGTMCPPGSGACLIRGSQKPLSLGHVHDDMVYDPATKEVKLTYLHGDPCPSNSKYNMTSVIILKCGHNDLFKDPELDSVTSECQYIFVWLTPLACEKNPAESYSSCSFYDDKDLVTYDLSALSEEVTVPSAHGGIFTIKACGHLEEKGDNGDTSCSQAAVCLKESKRRDGSYGAYDKATVKVNPDTKALTFKGGRTCISAGIERQASSTIHFKCGSTAGTGQPNIIDDGDCDAVFEWYTSLVCKPIKKDCIVTDHGAMFDFSLLSQDTGSWNYTDTDGNIYWLNLCQGVHGKALQSQCPHNSAVCLKTKDGFTSMLANVNTQSSQVSGDGKDRVISIKYTDGDTSVCTKNRRRRSDYQPAVTISLKCADTIGAPVLDNHNEEKCTYEFKWNTRMACPTDYSPAPVKEEKGIIKDERSDKQIDLNSLLKPGVNEELTIGDQTYLFNLKGQLDLSKNPSAASVCNQAAICHYSGKTKKYRNLGSSTKKTYYLLDDQLEVKFTSPEKCTGKKSNTNIYSTVIFYCVHNKTQHGVDFLYHTSDCAFVFVWKTDIVCPHASPGVIDTSGTGNAKGSGEASDSGSGSNNKKIIIGVIIFLCIATICLIVLVFHKPEKRAAAAASIKRCILCRRRKETQFSYSVLSQSAENADLDMKDDDFDPLNPFDQPEEEAEINNGHMPATIRTYHDDSDDDIILT